METTESRQDPEKAGSEFHRKQAAGSADSRRRDGDPPDLLGGAKGRGCRAAAAGGGDGARVRGDAVGSYGKQAAGTDGAPLTAASLPTQTRSPAR